MKRRGRHSILVTYQGSLMKVLERYFIKTYLPLRVKGDIMRTVALVSSATLLSCSLTAVASTTWGVDAYVRPITRTVHQQAFTHARTAVSDGSGYDGPSTATGGPSGGLPGRS